MRCWKSWRILLFSSIIVFANCEFNEAIERTSNGESSDEIAKLPYCVEEQDVGYVLVSTLDGKLSALQANGNLAWEVDTGSGPLLHSSIHNVELTNQGELVRIIPSLSGSLYKFNGKTIDAIPINADTLLKSSFLYSSDTVIAGRREVRTYGVVARTGDLLYECSSDGCRNITQTTEEFDDIIVIERSTATVRAHEPRTGQERWNFSVGYHNIKIPPASCINLDSAITSLNITAILPDGVISASRKATFEHLWSHQFEAPIVKIWKWDGRDLYAVDVFVNSPGRKADQFALTLSPAIYLGMHKQQLYIHESIHMLSALQKYNFGNGGTGGSGGTDVAATKSWTSFPWKPVPAGQLQDEVDDATAISVLYSSNYVDGNGYYFYTDADRKKTIFCDTTRNDTSRFFQRFEGGSVFKSILVTIGFVFITALATQFKTIYNWIVPQRLTLQKLEEITRKNSKLGQNSSSKSKSPKFETANTDLSLISSNSSTSVASVYNDARPPQSHFLNNFEIISQLGKGGYGIVFEVKQKIDNANYAVKIIPLPQRPVAKERVLREVVALARLDHPNIVRYSTSWNEDTLPDLSTTNLRHALADSSLFNTDIYEEETEDGEVGNTDVAKIPIEDVSDESSDEDSDTSRNYQDDDSFIVFANDGDSNNHSCSNSNSTRVTVHTETSITTASKSTRDFHKSISIYDSDSEQPQETSSLLSNRSNNFSNSNIKVKGKVKEKDREKDRRYLFIQMQLCDKMTLKDWMGQNAERPRLDIFAIYRQILQAVEYIHSLELIHRDLKPSNIFFNANCSPAQIKVGDFGLVTPMQSAEGGQEQSFRGDKFGHTRDAGTALYMSPEQRRGSDYNYKVDIFSLGVILFELLVYFGTEGERIDMLIKLRSGRFPENFQRDHPQEYTLLKSMLSSKADNRPTVTEVMQQIAEFCGA